VAYGGGDKEEHGVDFFAGFSFVDPQILGQRVEEKAVGGGETRLEAEEQEKEEEVDVDEHLNQKGGRRRHVGASGVTAVGAVQESLAAM
jgi:hypothetical protein